MKKSLFEKIAPTFVIATFFGVSLCTYAVIAVTKLFVVNIVLSHSFYLGL